MFWRGYDFLRIQEDFQLLYGAWNELIEMKNSIKERKSEEKKK